MSYWSGEKLAERLGAIIDPYLPENIDCNSYTLTIGDEVYVTPHHEIKDTLSYTKMRLAENQPFSIPPGQFAYLITEETISIPTEVMAFISMKSTAKFRGLINVSGFHVDPGYEGKLIFAVFNAGPTKLNLQRGQPIFLIWFSDLDRVSEEPYIRTKSNQRYSQIPTSFIDNIPGQIHSIKSLYDKIEENRHKIEVLNTVVRFFIPFVIGIGILIVGLAANYFIQFLPTATEQISPTEHKDISAPPQDSDSSTNDGD